MVKRKPAKQDIVDTLLDRLVKVELENRLLREAAEMMREAFNTAMKRQIVVAMTDEHLNKIVEGLGRYLIEHGKDIKWTN